MSLQDFLSSVSSPEMMPASSLGAAGNAAPVFSANLESRDSHYLNIPRQLWALCHQSIPSISPRSLEFATRILLKLLPV